MYLDQLRREQHDSILAGIRRWESAIDTVMAGLTRLRRMFALGPANRRTEFHVHRVPGTDALR